jgi:hypothetical protein
MKVTVHILSFSVGDQAREFEWDAPGPEVKDALEQAFREFEEGAAHVERKCRSMSVGDVVRADGKYYACAAVGWTEIDEGEFLDLASMSFAQRLAIR